MKKLILTLFAALVLSAGTAMAQSANGYIGKARGAAHDCLNDYNGPGWNVWASESIVSACFVDGFITQVLFAAVPVVPAEEIGNHPPPLPIIVAVVLFGCDGEIIENSCF